MRQLFSKADLKPEPRVVPPDEPRPRPSIPTGAPRVVDSARTARGRDRAEAWRGLLDAVELAARARLDLLRARDDGEQLACPWAAVEPCGRACRCRGLGRVTVHFLRDHYGGLGKAIAKLGRRP